jgi:dolichol-phosphate mannosyltransferase
MGFLTALFAFLNLVYWIVMKVVFNHHAVEGWTSLVTILLLFFGIIMIQISVIGEYVARIYEEVRNRPLYIISKQDGREKRKE